MSTPISAALAGPLAALAKHRQFIVYQAQPDVMRPGKTSKYPVDFRSGRVANAHDAKIWTDAQTAIAAADTYGAQFGIGYVFTEADDLWFLDLDNCLLPDGSGWSPVAVTLCQMFAGAAIEISQSGRGLHIFGSGRPPAHGCKNEALSLEFYDKGRFVALTGTGATGDAGADFSHLLPTLVAQYFPPDASQALAQEWTDAPDPEWRGPADDAELLRRALQSRSSQSAFGARASFADLWTANVEALARCYPDPVRAYDSSSADAALAQHLAFWTGKCCTRIERMMRASALVRDKWEREDYLRRTIMGAVGRQVEVLTDKADARREALREELRRVGDGASFDPLPEVLSVDAMLARFVFLSDGSRVHDRLHPGHVLNFADFKNATASSFTELDTGEFTRDGKPKIKRVPNAALWLNHGSRQTAVSSTFKAGGNPFVIDPNGRHCVNLWAGFDRTVDGSDGDPAIFLEHVRWLFQDRADDFLDWIAHIEQSPGVLPHTAWLHVSSNTGTGRNALAAMLTRVFAGYVAPALDLVHVLDSGFNERLSRKILAICDEIREGGGGQWRHAEALKQTITATARNINTKYGRQSLEHNACRFLLFSNHRSAIPLDDTDRRIEIVICDEPPRDAEYYRQLYRAADDPTFIASVAAWLRARDLSKFNPGRHSLKSAAREQVIATSRSPALTGLIAFGETYPFELATASRLELAAGMIAFSSDARKLLFAAQEAGWERIGRCHFNGQRPILYARRAVFAKWSSKGVDYRSQLPAIDGGLAQWLPEIDKL